MNIHNAILSRAPLKFQLFCAAVGFLYVYLSPEQDAPGLFFLILKAVFGVVFAISIAGFYTRYKEHSQRRSTSQVSESALLHTARQAAEQKTKNP